MREKRGALGRTVGAVAGSLANAARRSQAAALTRVVVYDAAGHPTLLRPEAPEHAALADAAEELIATAREGRPRGRAAAPDDAAAGLGEPAGDALDEPPDDPQEDVPAGPSETG